MNRLDWKREHQIALACAAALGCLASFLISLHELDTYTSFRWGALWCTDGIYGCAYLLNGYWLRVAFWSTVGGIAGGALVYIRQLLRA